MTKSQPFSTADLSDLALSEKFTKASLSPFSKRAVKTLTSSPSTPTIKIALEMQGSAGVLLEELVL